MTKTEKAKSIIVGSFILYLINSLLDETEQNNATTIRLFQLLRSKTSQAQNKAYIELSNKAWSMTIKDFSGKDYRIAIFDAVESLAFAEQDVCTKMYGSNFLPYSTSFCYKQTSDETSKDVLKESREVTKTLIKNIQKVVFDNKGKL